MPDAGPVPPNTFAGLAVDRHADQRADPAWVAAERVAPGARLIVLDTAGRALADVREPALVRFELAAGLAGAGGVAPTYLGRDAQGPLFVVAVDAASPLAADRAWLELSSAGAQLGAFDAGLFAYARAVMYWQARTRYCMRCGAPLVLGPARLRARCSACGTEFFPRVDPAMIVIVTWRDACLLGRKPDWMPGRFSTLAGFVDPGESLEDAVRREVLEEAGVAVGDLQYHSSQPWPFPASLMVGFTARASAPAITRGSELSDVRWFTAADLVHGLAEGSLVTPPPVSVSYRLIAHWLRESAGLELSELAARARPAVGQPARRA